MRVPLRILGDDTLATMVTRGSASAEAELFERHHRELVAFCRSILLDAHEADEAAQAAFVKALAALRRRPPDAPLRPWLFRIAHNESINLIRHRRRHASLDAAPPVVVAPADVAADQRERLHELVRDLQALPERQRSALLMREMSGFSYDEIATSLCSSEPAVRQTVFEARQALAEFREGRALECSSVRSVLEAGDRRSLRGKRLRAHLRGCPECEAVCERQTSRRRDLRLLLPALPASGLLSLLGGGGATGVATGGLIKLVVGAAAITATVGAVEVPSHHDAVPPPVAAARAPAPDRDPAAAAHAQTAATTTVAATEPHDARPAPAERGSDLPPGWGEARRAVRAAGRATGDEAGAPAAAPVQLALTLPISTGNARVKVPVSTAPVTETAQDVQQTVTTVTEGARQQVAAAQELARQQVAAAQAQTQAAVDAAAAQTQAALQTAADQTQAALAAAQAQVTQARGQVDAALALLGQPPQ